MESLHDSTHEIDRDSLERKEPLERFSLLMQRFDNLLAAREWPGGLEMRLPATNETPGCTIYLKRYVEDVSGTKLAPDFHLSARWVRDGGAADMVDTSVSGLHLEDDYLQSDRRAVRLDSLRLLEVSMDAFEHQLSMPDLQ